MTLAHLEVQDFRCIAQARLDFDIRCTLISGANGSGKTSLLEAIHVLSCGHSFRSNSIDPLVKTGAPFFRLIGSAGHQEAKALIGVQSADGLDVHLSGRKVQGFAEVAPFLPVQVIDPEVHRLLEDGPKRRRRFMDWGVFHVEPRFIDAWRRYQRSLRQRNAALKAKSSKELITSWDVELIETGTFVAECRESYLAALQGDVERTSQTLLGQPVVIRHRKGWGEDRSLAEALLESWGRDSRYGSTSVGPHRADVAVEIDGCNAQERVSRGQQKLLASAMMLAQLSHRASETGDPACLLLDDPAAELDVDNLKKLLAEIAETPAQLIVTALDLNLLSPYLSGKRFHVKQGDVVQML